MEDCIFCRIVAGEIPATVVAEDDQVLAFEDISPEAPVHILVIPKMHIHNSSTVEATDEALVGHLVRVGCQAAAEQGIAESGFRLVLNNGADAGEAVNHLHLHVLGGRELRWPPG